MSSIAQINVQTHNDADGRGVRWLIFDNVERRNALNERMWNELPKLVRSAAVDPGIRAIVLTGAGDQAFSAGADISEFEALRAPPTGRKPQGFRQLGFWCPARLPEADHRND